MIFDKREHQEFILVLISQAQIPGKLLDLAHEVKQAVEKAYIGQASDEAIEDPVLKAIK